MLQLTYISSVTPGTPEFAVNDILRASRHNNAAAGVTGLLLFDGRRFLQALEGEAEEVNAAYQRIKVDPRHRAMVLLSSSEVTERAFGDWAMAAQRVAGSGGASITEQIDTMTADVADANLRALFRSFAQVRAAT
jgi:hypothetical protein